MPSLTAVDLSQLQARLDGLEELLVERVLPILDRLDDRLAATAPNNDEELPASQDPRGARPRADVVRRRRGHGPGHGRGQGPRLLSFSLSPTPGRAAAAAGGAGCRVGVSCSKCCIVSGGGCAASDFSLVSYCR